MQRSWASPETSPSISTGSISRCVLSDPNFPGKPHCAPSIKQTWFLVLILRPAGQLGPMSSLHSTWIFGTGLLPGQSYRRLRSDQCSSLPVQMSPRAAGPKRAARRREARPSTPRVSLGPSRSFAFSSFPPSRNYAALRYWFFSFRRNNEEAVGFGIHRTADAFFSMSVDSCSN
jgi:hypothetical protein